VSLNRFHLVLIGGWCSTLAMVLAVRYAVGLPPTFLQFGLALLLAVFPVVVLLGVFRGAPDRSISQVIYDAEHVKNPTRDELNRRTQADRSRR
jgi:hypothetical protein